mmetsp:Transcript_109547/g.353543  ORF Transcript_109547/g.353543 Transcript_109547/m.353543 type:complete len:251 (-) Transcript_109547:1188-1940(-)
MAFRLGVSKPHPQQLHSGPQHGLVYGLPGHRWPQRFCSSPRAVPVPRRHGPELQEHSLRHERGARGAVLPELREQAQGKGHVGQPARRLVDDAEEQAQGLIERRVGIRARACGLCRRAREGSAKFWDSIVEAAAPLRAHLRAALRCDARQDRDEHAPQALPVGGDGGKDHLRAIRAGPMALSDGPRGEHTAEDHGCGRRWHLWLAEDLEAQGCLVDAGGPRAEQADDASALGGRLRRVRDGPDAPREDVR